LCAGFAIGLLAIMAGTPRGEANSIVLSLDTTSFSAGLWTYTYDVALTTDSALHSGAATAAGGRVSLTDGDYFGIYDIPGYVTGSATNISLTTVGGGTWVETDSLLGFQPDTGVTLPDNATLWNANFQYGGTDGGNAGAQTILGSTLSPDPGVPADGLLGFISIQSTLSPSGSKIQMYNGQDFNISIDQDASNQSFVVGPSTPGSGAAPEPGAALVICLTGCAMGMALLRRRGLQV
jgi:hypothetical protein